MGDKDTIEEWRIKIRDYQANLNEYKRLTKQVDDLKKENEVSSTGGGLVAFHQTIEGGLYDTTEHTLKRLNRRIERYRDRIYEVQLLLTNIESDKDFTMVDCLLDGMTVKETAKHLNVSRGTVHRNLKRVIKNHHEQTSYITS